MINKELIKTKISQVLNYLEEIDSVKSMDILEILRDIKTLRFFERNFQLIIDTILDINSHIIMEENLGIPESYSNTFIILGENEIIPLDFAYKIAEAVKLRNMIVHKYDKIDNKKMMQDLKDEMIQFTQYIVYVNEFIDKK